MTDVLGPAGSAGGTNRWRALRGVLAAGLLVGSAAACGGEPAPDVVAAPLAAVEVTGPDGVTTSTVEWVGEPLVINFWYSTCPPCARELADFAEVDAERDDVRFIGINPLDDVADMIEFAGDRGVSYDLFRDETASLQDDLDIASFPSTVFVDAAGSVVKTTGVLDAEQLHEEIDALLDGEITGVEAHEGGEEERFAGGWHGIIRDPLPQVGDVELPTVHDPDVTLGFTADPGRVRIVYFGFTACPDVCPTTMSDLAVALRLLGDDATRVDTVMVSVDPDRDVGALARYVEAFVPGSTGLLTDDLALLRAAAAPFGADWEVRHLADGVVEVDHTAFLYAVDDRGRLVVTWPFGVSSEHLADDIARILEPGATT